MRDLFVGQLERLTYEIVEMGGICEEAIQKGSEALLSGDAALAQETAPSMRKCSMTRNMPSMPSARR